jgi:uroporphyrinogen-III synthase
MRGKRIAVLESRLGKELADLVAKRGAIPVHAPALAEVPDLDREAISKLIEGFSSRPPALVIFQTGVGTHALFAATDQLGLTNRFLEVLASSKVAARGPKPSGALRVRHVRIDYNAKDPFTTKEVMDSIRDFDLKGTKVVVQRFGTQNLELDRALEARGAAVDEIPVYRWSLPADIEPLKRLVEAAIRGDIDAVVFTNAEQFRNLMRVSNQMGRKQELKDALNRVTVASIGPVASNVLRADGIKIRIEASPPKLGALLDSLFALA